VEKKAEWDAAAAVVVAARAMAVVEAAAVEMVAVRGHAAHAHS